MAKKANKGSFTKGDPRCGRPPGKANKATEDAREFAQKFIDDHDYKDSLRRRILRGSAPHMETLIWHYRYGKPKDVLDLNLAELAPLRIVIEDARES